MDYFVYSSLSHDGRSYKRGDRVTLSDSAARRLQSLGVVGTEPVAAEVPAHSNDRVQTPERKAELRDAKVGGEPASSGEPSHDGQEPAERKEAEDVSPKLEDLSRAELDEQAAKEGVEAEAIAKAPNKGAVIELITAKRAEPKQPAEPAIDASADL